VTPSGNAQISTAQSKFGGASALFDGTTDILSIPTDASFDFETGDFTIEWFQYWNSIAGYQTLYDYGYTGANSLLLQTNTGTGKYRVYMGGSQILEETNAATTGVWYYYGLTRSGTTVTLYRDGVSNGSGTSAVSVTGYALGIGSQHGTGSFCLNGYVDELRVTKGVARDVTSVPTEEFPDV